MKKILALFFGGLLIVCFFAGCNVETAGDFDLNKDDCSREKIFEIVSGDFSGKGYSDDRVIALKFVYENDVFKEKYGDDFDVDEPIRTKGKLTIIIPRSFLYKGETTCYLTVGGDKWIVVVEKGYMGRWNVVDYHLYSSADGEWINYAGND